MFKMKISRSI